MNFNQANFYNNSSFRKQSNRYLFSNNSHALKYLHIHDNDATGVTYNCLGISILENLIQLQKQNEEFDFDDALNYLFNTITLITNEQSGGIGFISIDKDLSNFIGTLSLKELIKKIRLFFKSLNLPLRNGYEKAYISFNLGLDTSDNGRKIIEAFLKALELGDFTTGEPFIFPNIIFKVKNGINHFPNDKNYDLFQLATKISGLRMNPTYFNCDNSSVNKIDPHKIGIMGCRTLLSENINGDFGAINRGNIACVSLNLPKIAKLSMNKKDFFYKLKKFSLEARDILLKRYELLCKLNTNLFNLILENNFYLNSMKAIENSSLEEAFKNGTLSLGFIGLFEAISYLEKKNISIELIENNINLGKEILRFMRNLTDQWTLENQLNFSLLASAGEGISGRFAEEDDKYDFYTNSFHIPVYISMDPFKKLDIESQFASYCNGGSISYIEFYSPVIFNGEAISDIINYGIEKNLVYMGINFPLDYCPNCKFTGYFPQDHCPNCFNHNVIQLRRVSGYLSNKETLKAGKKQEEKLRISHLMGGSLND